jgi:hypothetical protein
MQVKLISNQNTIRQEKHKKAGKVYWESTFVFVVYTYLAALSVRELYSVDIRWLNMDWRIQVIATDEVKPKCSEKNLSLCYFVQLCHLQDVNSSHPKKDSSFSIGRQNTIRKSTKSNKVYQK